MGVKTKFQACYYKIFNKNIKFYVVIICFSVATAFLFCCDTKHSDILRVYEGPVMSVAFCPIWFHERYHLP